MKIFIDDIRNAPDESWHVCRTITSAIKALAMFGTEITEISLDHDISHQVAVGTVSRPYPCDETFEAVALYIALMAEHRNCDLSPLDGWKPLITIHTANPSAGRRMQKTLSDAGIESDLELSEAANRLEMNL